MDNKNFKTMREGYVTHLDYSIKKIKIKSISRITRVFIEEISELEEIVKRYKRL